MPLAASRTGVWLAGSLLALFLFRLWFAAALPLTGDEAYFVVWGQQLAGGYYDHPPMVGWWLAALLQLGRAEWWLRLPAVLAPFLLAWGAWWLLRGEGEGDEERARFAALLTLLQPTHVWNVLITTDTPVVVFSFLSVLAYVHGCRRAGRTQSLLWHALAGVLLGLAFLGKYFAALLGFAFAAHVLFVRRDRGRWGPFVALTLCALLGPAWNLWWNSEHCWANVVFNFFNRQGKAGFDWQNPLLFLVSLAYLLTPWLLWALWRSRQACRATLVSAPAASRQLVLALGWLAGVPLLAFFALSLRKSVGLHWLLAFMPLLAVLAAALLPVRALWQVLRWSAVFALLHALAAIVLLALPTSVWKGTSIHADAVLTLRGAAVERALREPLARCGEGCTVAMESYSAAATLGYAINRRVVVFGDGSFHGRQDDFDTDFRQLAGRDFLILRKETVSPERYAPFFERIELVSFEIEGVAFHAVLAQGFRYAVYHERMLTRVRDRFYAIPAWLPQRACDFKDRYFSDPAR